MLSLILDDFKAMASCGSKAALRAAIERLTGELDFERYALQYVTPLVDGRSQWTDIENVPEGYRPVWSDGDKGRVCPVMQHAKRSSLPFVWGQSTFVAAGMGEKWAEQQPFGFGYGFMVAVHLPGAKHVVSSLDRSHALMDTPVQLTRKLAQFQLFTTYAIDACVNILGAEAPVPADCKLTPRELEALKWTLEGKTAWEVGHIMKISERTAALHANSATHKLGTANKHHAALKALRLGWIS